MYKIDKDDGEKSCINLQALKPLKNLQYYLQNSPSHNNSLNLCRALFELFFFAEKLAIKWGIQREYRAHMRDKEEFIEQICETSYLIKLVMNSLSLNEEAVAVDATGVTSMGKESEEKKTEATRKKKKATCKFEKKNKTKAAASNIALESDEVAAIQSKNESTLDTSRESGQEATNENISPYYDTETDENDEETGDKTNLGETTEENDWSD